MLAYRVFPHHRGASAGEPGHALFIHPDQGLGRWDNVDLYQAIYVSATASGAIGETFAHLSTWSSAMLPFPAIEGAERMLGVYSFDEELHPLLNFDDPKVLLERALRPTEIVIRNRPRTQQIARNVFMEQRWSGVSWWSMHRPQWALTAMWHLDGISVEEIQPLPGNPALVDAARVLAKHLDDDIT
ncbi:MAG TPA: RES domain-containing protein [Acidimicrobiales bacterium]|nr:RES domain-containing protein [Acidimicrobiales bacterium]